MLKKIYFVMIMLLMLCGCGMQRAQETVTDQLAEPQPVEKQQVLLTLPEQAAIPAMESTEGALYFCEDYTVTLHTMESGDLEETLEAVTGFTKEALQLLQTQMGETDRYECVWTAAGDGGNIVCRAAILDDGNYHYVLTAMAEEASAGTVQSAWQTIFRSFRLRGPQEHVNSGS